MTNGKQHQPINARLGKRRIGAKLIGRPPKAHKTAAINARPTTGAPFMRAEDVTDTLDLALKASGCGSATVLHKPRLLSDNDPRYIADELAEYIEV